MCRLSLHTLTLSETHRVLLRWYWDDAEVIQRYYLCSAHESENYLEMEASWEAVLFTSEDELCSCLDKNNIIRIHQIILKWMISLIKIWHVRGVCVILTLSVLSKQLQSLSSLVKRTASQLASISQYISDSCECPTDIILGWCWGNTEISSH